MVKNKDSENQTQHGLDEDRLKAVRQFEESDPTAKRFGLFFDMLRMRGVDLTQASRTAHLLCFGAKPSDDGPSKA